MRKTLLCMTAISGVFTSCRNQQSTSVDIMPAQTVAEYFTQQLQHPLVIQEAANTDGLKHDAFDINGMRIHGDTLLVDVAFSGGCDQHEFTMSTNKQWLNLVHVSEREYHRTTISRFLKDPSIKEFESVYRMYFG
mgnify:CR=1 FL=1